MRRKSKFSKGDTVILARHHKELGDYGIPASCFGKRFMISAVYGKEGHGLMYSMVPQGRENIGWAVYEQMLDPMFSTALEKSVVKYIDRELGHA